jgi:hypothetical protein
MAGTSSAKVKYSRLRSIRSSQNTISSKNVQALEERLRLYLEHRINHTPASAQNRLNESDLFLLAKVWNSLSPEFRQLYKEATQIPSGYTSYVSPSGHFEVYYTTTLDGSVDPTDNYGFGAAGNWRTKNNQPNGVPDYVDEVAWALDSAWSMEVGQFQYVQPIPYTDAQHGSTRSKVVITSLDPGYYGLTFPDDQVGPHGFSSHTEIRNEWSDQDWAETGYDTVPYNGARVTCAHEFFHTIQYAMAWSVDNYGVPDSFPLSWTEGTAVMMEGLAFRYVFDYLQYTSLYFNDPTIIMLNPSEADSAVYTNSLITKFLHELYSPAADNDFIRHVFFSDYDTLSSFYKILRSQSLSVGENWVDILNAFHTQSYFTGTRAIPGIFIQDAPLLPQWNFTYDVFDVTQTITMQVSPFSMQHFAIQPAQIPGDTLYLIFQGDLPTGAPYPYPTWSASCIAERPNGADSILHFVFSNSTLASLEIPAWTSLKDAIVIATNGDIAASHNASISIQTCPVTYPAGSQHTFVAATNTDTAVISLKAQANLRCSLTVAAVKNDSLLAIAERNQLTPVSSLFSISFPAIWSTGSSIVLAINSHTIIPTTNYALGLYRWNNSLWSKVKDSVSYANQSLRDIASLVQPGIYSVFYSSLSPVDTISSVAVFPNPVRLKRDGSIAFRGKSLLELWIFSVDGTLITHDVYGQNNQPRSVTEVQYGFDWRLCSTGGTAVPPGVYFARIGYKDPITKGMKKQSQKMFVVP